MFTADSAESKAAADMTRKECNEPLKVTEEVEQSKLHRKRRSGLVTASPSGRRFLSVEYRDIPFPSVGKLVEKYSMLIVEQPNLNSRDARVCKCCEKEAEKCFYFSSAKKNDEGRQKSQATDRLSLSIKPSSSINSEFSSPISDDGVWFLDARGSDSAIGTLPESDDDKCSYLLLSRSNSVPCESRDDDLFDSVDNIPTANKLPMENHFRRRQTWTGPLLKQAQEYQLEDAPDKLLVRKTCSLDQSTKKFNELNSLGLRHLYRARRKESNLSNDDFDDDDVAYRSVRTPSVVISDHSDDPNFASSTITLEEIEEYQNDRLNDQMNNVFGDSSSDCSGTSIWSNYNNCVTELDNEYNILNFERKTSDCSTCSTLSCDEEEYVRKPSGWRKLRRIVQWTPFIQTYKKQRYPWVQLAGHQGNFKAGPEPGTILKKLCPKEQMCFQVLMKDALKPFVPEYKGFITTDDGELYLQLQDLLSEFSSPCVMDCKIGVRTYLEEELAKAKEKPKLRKDMYEKMIQIDPTAPTDEEHRFKGVTKPRYMIWRETISSTATLGFRIEGIRKSDGKSSKDFKTTKTREQIVKAFQNFISGFPNVLGKYIQRLQDIKKTLLTSKFFATHEVIGSSLLFVHDDNNAGVWLIDFAKTIVLPSEVKINHDTEWVVGNHEDGYLIGLNNLIEVFTELSEKESSIVIELAAPSKDEVT